MFSLLHYHLFTSQHSLKMDINLHYIKCNADENWVQSYDQHLQSRILKQHPWKCRDLQFPQWTAPDSHRQILTALNINVFPSLSFAPRFQFHRISHQQLLQNTAKQQSKFPHNYKINNRKIRLISSLKLPYRYIHDTCLVWLSLYLKSGGFFPITGRFFFFF